MNRNFKLFAMLATLGAALCIAPPADAQSTTPSTTLASAMGQGDTTVNLSASTFNSYTVQARGLNNQVMTALYIDGEYMVVASNANPLGTGNVWNVIRTQNTGGSRRSAHVSGATVWAGPPSVFDQGPYDRVGACTASTFQYLPIVEVRSGTLMNCDGNGKYSPMAVGAFYVPPTQCTFAPTTSTVTNTYPQVGASNIFVLNGTTNSAAGTTTLVCNILVPTNVAALRGAIITDVTLFVGSQTTAPTSLGTSTLGTITFPAAATSETASTVTPVAIGGTVTTTSPTAITTVTTAGSFLTIKHTYSTVVDLSPDLRLLQYTMPFLQSAAAVMTLNTPGLLVHYRAGI